MSAFNTDGRRRFLRQACTPVSYTHLDVYKRQVMKVMTRKMLKSSLAATKLAEKMPISALIGLPVMASTTRKAVSYTHLAMPWPARLGRAPT